MSTPQITPDKPVTPEVWKATRWIITRASNRGHYTAAELHWFRENDPGSAAAGWIDGAGWGLIGPNLRTPAVPATFRLMAVTWEPVRAGRFLGVEKVEDADACRIHVAAEAPYDAQLKAIQAGTATCFTQAFTREPSDD